MDLAVFVWFQSRSTMLLFSIIYTLLGVSEASLDAKRLYDDLLLKGAYNKLIRPVSNMSNILVVRLGLRLTQIIDVVSIMMVMAVC